MDVYEDTPSPSNSVGSSPCSSRKGSTSSTGKKKKAPFRNLLTKLARSLSKDSGKSSSRPNSEIDLFSDVNSSSGRSTPEVDRLLQTVNLKGIAGYIASGECKRVVVMTGAGISTAAGIPDFRSPKTGLYANLQKFNLANSQDIFDIKYFRDHPEAFYTLAKDLFPGMYKPTVSHYFIKLLEKKGLLLRNFTQNIDCLERLAGISDDKIVEAHGSFKSSRCVDCATEYNNDIVRSHVLQGEVLRCHCAAPVKPDIVFFGESLPQRYLSLHAEDFKNCDLLIVMGTSLQVQPFASLIDSVPKECPRLLINRECAGIDMIPENPLQDLLGDGVVAKRGFQFFSDRNYRDVFEQNTCDDGVKALVEVLGWGDDLQEVINMEEDAFNVRVGHFIKEGDARHYSVVNTLDETVDRTTVNVEQEDITESLGHIVKEWTIEETNTHISVKNKSSESE